MRFGIREICDVVFKPLTSVDIGNQHFDAFQPVLFLDTAKTSTLEQKLLQLKVQLQQYMHKAEKVILA